MGYSVSLPITSHITPSDYRITKERVHHQIDQSPETLTQGAPLDVLGVLRPEGRGVAEVLLLNKELERGVSLRSYLLPNL